MTADVLLGSKNLRNRATADGLQVTGDALSANHHAANVLFNIMRGGLFEDNYRLDKDDLLAFCRSWNRPVVSANADFASLPADLTYHQLLDGMEHCDDPQLERLCRGIFPSVSVADTETLTPLNRFAIGVRDEAGNGLNYEGNWRDISKLGGTEDIPTPFRLWLSPSLSTPARRTAITLSDYPGRHRLGTSGTRKPLANIGYWGDHQLIYLLKD